MTQADGTTKPSRYGHVVIGRTVDRRAAIYIGPCTPYSISIGPCTPYSISIGPCTPYSIFIGLVCTDSICIGSRMAQSILIAPAHLHGDQVYHLPTLACKPNAS